MMLEDKGTILVVDDDDGVRSLLRQALESAGHQVLAARDGLESMRILSEYSVEVMLLDMRMPGMSGLEVLKQVLLRHPDVMVIMQTGVTEVQVAVDAMKQGAYDYLIKPFDVDHLSLRVQRARERRFLVMREREHQQEMERRVQEQEQRLRQQFAELVQGAAREHELSVAMEDLRTGNKPKIDPFTPSAKTQPAKTPVDKFSNSLLRILRGGDSQ